MTSAATTARLKAVADGNNVINTADMKQLIASWEAQAANPANQGKPDSLARNADQARAAVDLRIARAKLMADGVKKERRLAELTLARKMAVDFPPEKYGMARVPIRRGLGTGVELFGASLEDASEAQRAARRYFGWTGAGEYNTIPGTLNAQHTYDDAAGVRHYTGFTGQGGFWSSLWDGIKSVGRELAPIGKEALKAGIEVGVPMLVKALGKGKYVMDPQNQAKLWERLVSHPEGQKLIEELLDDDEIDAAAKTAQVGKRVRAVMESDTEPSERKRTRLNTATDYGNPEFAMNNLIDHGAAHSRTNPKITTAPDETGDLIFSYREFIRDVISPNTSFTTAEKIELNPGLPASFPLLSNFAQFFEEYQFEQLIFHFKSLITEGYSQAAGAFMMVPLYNPSNPVLPDKRSCENTDQCVSGKITADLYCGIECDPSKRALGGNLYVRTDDVPRDQRRTFDLGFLQVATAGAPKDLTLGELWVEYKVRLSKLRVVSSLFPAIGDGISLLMPNGLRYGVWAGQYTALQNAFAVPNGPAAPVTGFTPYYNAFRAFPMNNLVASMNLTPIEATLAQGLSLSLSSGDVASISKTFPTVSITYVPSPVAADQAQGYTQVYAKFTAATGQRYRITCTVPLVQALGINGIANSVILSKRNIPAYPIQVYYAPAGSTGPGTNATIPMVPELVIHGTFVSDPPTAALAGGQLSGYSFLMGSNSVWDLVFPPQQYTQTGQVELYIRIQMDQVNWGCQPNGSQALAIGNGGMQFAIVRLPSS
jgi:hypothetical protein